VKKQVSRVLAVLTSSLGLALALSAVPALAETQSQEERQTQDQETSQAQAQTSEEAQGQGQVSLPDPTTAGEPLPEGGRIAIEVAPGSPIHGTNVRAAGGPFTGTQAELSMAVSGPSIVITFNGGPNGGGYVTSTDGGVTFGPMTSPPRPMGSNPCCDTGVAADLIGRFYYLELYRNDGAGNCTNSLHVSTNGGQTFGGIVGSPFSYATGTTDFPDMPHMGIDRVNLVGGNPQLYVFSRHFTSGINCPQTGGSGTVQGEVVCSTNGGAAWTAPIVLAPFTDTAHLAAGSDGSVYIVGNGLGGTILLRRSTNDCNAGLAFGGAVTVASGLTFGGVGIDREFAQPYVAADRLNPNVAYVAWSSDRLTGDNDRDIFLARCTFTGTAGSCEAPVRVNDDPIGTGNDQYFPMLCVDPNNQINLSWNDQRAGANSTAIFHTEVGTAGGSLAVGPSFLVSEVNFTPFNFGGTPDYGDYNENVDACDAQHLYVAWVSHVSPPGITPASNDPDIFFAVVNHLQDVRVEGPLDFGDVCRNATETRELRVFNVGDATLTVNGVTRVAGSADITVEPNPVTPLTIGPDAHVDFVVRCTPTSLGLKTATIRVASDDPDQPQIDLTATCNAAAPNINATLADDGDFGDVCVGSERDLTLQLLNQGRCDLTISSITSGDSNFTVPLLPQLPIVLSPDANVDVPIRFAPDPAQACGTTARTATITVASDDPDTANLAVDVSGTVPCPDVRVSGSGSFADVCAGAGAEQTVSVCNVGACDLEVISASLGACADFTIVNNPFPAPVGPDVCVPLTIRFTPTSPGPKMCDLVVTTDDPDQPTVTIQVTANTPLASIDVPFPSGQRFPPEVIQSLGACQTLQPFPISNTGTCNLQITNIAVGGSNAGDFRLSGLPSFPILLEPGHVAGEGDLNAVFAPTAVDRDRLAEVSVTYADPISGAPTTVTRALCGEGVMTGARVLVTAGGVPLPMVEQIHLQRLNGNRNNERLDTQDVAMDLPLQTVTPTPPCPSFQYHREYGTVSNPIQLAPGSYSVTVAGIVGGRRARKTVGFDVTTCDFNPTIVVDLP